MRPYLEIVPIGALWTNTRPSQRSTPLTARLTARSSEDFGFQKSRTITFWSATALSTGSGRSPGLTSAALAAAWSRAALAAVEELEEVEAEPVSSPVAFWTAESRDSCAEAAPLAESTALPRPWTPGA